MAISPYSFPLVNDLLNPRIYFGDDVSTDAIFVVGDIIVNTSPAIGKPTYWVCTDTTPTFAPGAIAGELSATALAITAAGSITGAPALVTTSGFAGNVTLGAASSFTSGFEQSIINLTTHAVTLVAPTGAAILGLNGAITSATTAARLKLSGTNWYRLA